MVEESGKSERENIMSKQIDKIVKLIVSHKSRGVKKFSGDTGEDKKERP